MTDIEKKIAKLEALRKKAFTRTRCIEVSMGRRVVNKPGGFHAEFWEAEDAEFYVAMHNYVPDLIAELDRRKLRAERAEKYMEEVIDQRDQENLDKCAANARANKAEALLKHEEEYATRLAELVVKAEAHTKKAEANARSWQQTNLQLTVQVAEINKHAEQMQAERDEMIRQWSFRNWGKCNGCSVFHVGICVGMLESREECRKNIGLWAASFDHSDPLPWEGKTGCPGFGSPDDCDSTQGCQHDSDCAESARDTTENYCLECGLLNGECRCAQETAKAGAKRKAGEAVDE